MTKSGWRNESYRHYLAAKGIATKYKYYSKFGDFIRDTGDELNREKERYYRTLPAKEAVKLHVQNQIIAKEQITPLSDEERKEVTSRLNQSGRSSLGKQRLELGTEKNKWVHKDRPATIDALKHRLSTLQYGVAESRKSASKLASRFPKQKNTILTTQAEEERILSAEAAKLNADIDALIKGEDVTSRTFVAREANLFKRLRAKDRTQKTVENTVNKLHVAGALKEGVYQEGVFE
jgi:hypothetical protein